MGYRLTDFTRFLDQMNSQLPTYEEETETKIKC